MNGTPKTKYMNQYIKWIYENTMYSTRLFFDISLQEPLKTQITIYGVTSQSTATI